MDQDTRTFLEQFEKRIEKGLEDMEKRLEDRIKGFMDQADQSLKENYARHKDFRADIKQCFGRIELNEKKIVAVEKDISRLEADLEDFKDGQESGKRFAWDKFAIVASSLIGVGGVIVAVVALS